MQGERSLRRGRRTAGLAGGGADLDLRERLVMKGERSATRGMGNLGASRGRGRPRPWGTFGTSGIWRVIGRPKGTGNLGDIAEVGFALWVTGNLGGPPLLEAGSFGTCGRRGLPS
jgi:hypothetical protein